MQYIKAFFGFFSINKSNHGNLNFSKLYLLTVFDLIFIVNKSYSYDFPKCSKIFHVAYFNAGYNYIEEKKNGIDKLLIQEIKKRSGCEFNEYEAPRARIWEELKTGNLDVATAGVKTSERDGFVYFSYYARVKNLTIIRKEVKYKSMKLFLKDKNLEFGVIRSFNYGSKVLNRFIDALKAQKRIQESASTEKLFLKLNNNHIQAFFSPFVTLKRYLNETDGLKNKVTIIDWIPDEKAYSVGIMLSKKTFKDDEFKKWDSIIQSIVNDGTLKKILLKYFTESEINKYQIMPY